MIRINTNGTKDRLFQLMSRVSNLNEEMVSPDKKGEIVHQFMLFADDRLNLNGDVPKVKLSFDESDAQKRKSFGNYNPDAKEILVVAANRNLGDMLRTLAHELVHYKQDKEGRLKPNSGETGSTEENEANSLAGVLMREFGKNNPIIFE
jgi:Zn-dependent peptidase ImmA (M78 family)